MSERKRDNNLGPVRDWTTERLPAKHPSLKTVTKYVVGSAAAILLFSGGTAASYNCGEGNRPSLDDPLCLGTPETKQADAPQSTAEYAAFMKVLIKTPVVEVAKNPALNQPTDIERAINKVDPHTYETSPTRAAALFDYLDQQAGEAGAEHDYTWDVPIVEQPAGIPPRNPVLARQ